MESLSASTAPVRAPEINRPGLMWLNCEKPLALADLKGKVVLLDFWTFCCINCIQILPALRKAEEVFRDELVVIGVHSPKFAAEKDPHNVQLALQRYDIRHPVIHDPELILWREYAVNAWPTLIMIDPAGTIIGRHSGEPEPLQLLNGLRDTIDHYDEKGLLEAKPFPWAKPVLQVSRLSFPGKIKKLPGPEKQWMVADSGHHQIVLFDDSGKESRRFGAGAQGWADASAEKTIFNSPQGLAADMQNIYVADTGNHSIRRIDRETGMVETIAGTGERGHLLLNKFERAVSRSIASPWDLEIKNQFLFFANAGTHQIGGIDLQENKIRLVAGNGAEGLRDGNPLFAQLAQPSALAFDSKFEKLYFADSETSSLRTIDMKEGMVRTLVGSNLFDFGHRNGKFAQARLQHALGLTLPSDNEIIVADSYNAALRRVDLEAKEVSDLEGEGWSCIDPVCLPLAEPAGIAADGPDRLLVSDTNNHRIVEVNRAAKTTRTWSQ